MRIIAIVFASLACLSLSSQDKSISLARLKYDGGGDWYVSPTSVPNLARFCNENINTSINEDEDIVEAASLDVFNYPFVHMTGHGNIIFSIQDAKNIRGYLLSGGFLNINDSYGMDEYIRRSMKEVFPELEFVELPFDHPIFHQSFNFHEGLPKIHEHDGKSPQALALFHEGRMVCFYNYESDLGDGWEDPSVHGDSEEVRMKALKMGANIIEYVFTNGLD